MSISRTIPCGRNEVLNQFEINVCNHHVLQKRLQTNVTLEEIKIDEGSVIFGPDKNHKNVMTDEVKNMMVALLERRQRRRRDASPEDATGQAIDTCLSYAGTLFSADLRRCKPAPSKVFNPSLC